MNLQTKEEQLFKRYLIRDVLQKKGYPRYAKALKDFYVKAPVFYNKIIKFAQYAMKMDVSFIIKWRIFRLSYIK